MRLDKFLTEMGLGTRSEVKGLIKKGRIRVNGAQPAGPQMQIDPDRDRVEADGKQVEYAAWEYYMLNKPAGWICAARDSRDPVVTDLITDRKRKDLFPAGRLDKDTEGLLLLTNDGWLAHSLLSPKRHVDKVYFARVRGVATEREAELFRLGLDIHDEKPALPAELKILKADRESGISETEVTVREGRYHQVKRMFQAVGMEVLYLKRLSMGPLSLDPGLEPGAYRPLTKEEQEALSRLASPR